MTIKILKALGMLDQNCKPVTYYKNDIAELSDHIALDLIKHGQAENWEGHTDQNSGSNEKLYKDTTQGEIV